MWDIDGPESSAGFMNRIGWLSQAEEVHSLGKIRGGLTGSTITSGIFQKQRGNGTARSAAEMLECNEKNGTQICVDPPERRTGQKLNLYKINAT